MLACCELVCQFGKIAAAVNVPFFSAISPHQKSVPAVWHHRWLTACPRKTCHNIGSGLEHLCEGDDSSEWRISVQTVGNHHWSVAGYELAGYMLAGCQSSPQSVWPHCCPPHLDLNGFGEDESYVHLHVGACFAGAVLIGRLYSVSQWRSHCPWGSLCMCATKWKNKRCDSRWHGCRWNRLSLHKHGSWSGTKLHALTAPRVAELASFNSKKETLPLQGKWAMKIQLRPLYLRCFTHSSGLKQSSAPSLDLYGSGFCLDRRKCGPTPLTSTRRSNYRFHLVRCSLVPQGLIRILL